MASALNLINWWAKPGKFYPKLPEHKTGVKSRKRRVGQFWFNIYEKGSFNQGEKLGQFSPHLGIGDLIIG